MYTYRHKFITAASTIELGLRGGTHLMTGKLYLVNEIADICLAEQQELEAMIMDRKPPVLRPLSPKAQLVTRATGCWPAGHHT